MHHDAIVLGLGGMGSAALCHLARRGARVLGIEQFDVAHDRGSSHGLTRIIRLAYYEHESYVPLLRRSWALWRDLERETGRRLLHITGSIDASREHEPVFAGSLDSCRVHGLPHEVLTSAELTSRFPGYRLPSDHVALFQPDGGLLDPEGCVRAHTELARSLGAELALHHRVLAWQPVANGIEVRTADARYTADRLVIAAGAWTGKLLPALAAVAVPERQVVAWFEPLRAELFAPERFPVFNLLADEGRFYGFPAHGLPAFKIGLYHHLGEIVDPDAPSRECDAEDEGPLRLATERYFPDAAGATLDMQRCLFTNSPDEHFVIGHLPAEPRVVVAAGFSGHGFKFCSVVGEILADLVLDGETGHEIGMFGVTRFG
jgi:sarcosine oxidase